MFNFFERNMSSDGEMRMNFIKNETLWPKNENRKRTKKQKKGGKIYLYKSY